MSYWSPDASCHGGPPGRASLACVQRRYLQQNVLTEISHLEGLDALETLNVSNNHIARLANLSCLPNLRTLIATHNNLSDLDSVKHVAELTALHTLDLQNNQISDPGIVECLKQIPDLRCLYLKGNPVVSAIKNYRKALVSSIPTLTYLDDRPVFEPERRTTMAW